ncbi:hypothetical protein EFE32_08265 [Lactococcus lactis subsp. lactis]|uniref:hypothetical protein n=1 Tax=Lactococcus lactis TaxID=1358 RepID=UPI00223BB216|nr:hypothetical protein [Lactococcus lactis]MCT0016829.1 hypothetical protein [Lactococcus lactis subsp. lactis]MCT0038412.1 hypothetical protein [Lactococcus lactis subsp. lactis]MCT3139870.1 hypothetical protein [Lactococcus lactis]
MNEELKTIKELADELGVIKQTIQYHVKFLPTKNRLKNSSGAIVLNLEEQRFIKNRLTKNRPKIDQKSTKEPTKNRQKKDKEISINNVLLEQLKTKDEQIKSLVEAQKQIQNLLDQQQRLALQDKKLLEEYKAENDSLKALKMPSQETEFKHLDNQYKDEMNALKEHLETLQEQIKVQKRIEEQEKPRKWWGLWRK